VGCSVLASGDPTGAYNIATGELNSLGDIAAAISEVNPDVRIRVNPGVDFLRAGPVYARFDINRAKHQLDFVSQYSLRSAVADYLRNIA